MADAALNGGISRTGSNTQHKQKALHQQIRVNSHDYHFMQKSHNQKVVELIINKS